MDFKGQKLNPYNINGGKYYNLTDSISPSEMNSVVDGVVYSQNLGRKAEIFAELIERTIVDNEMTSSYDTRETADGRDILDQKTIVTQIQGDTVAVDNTLKHAYFKGIKSTGRNLIPFPYKDTNKTSSGITWTVNSDGSVTANGTATENSTFTLIGGYIPIQGKHTFSGTIGGTGIYTDYALVCQFWSGNSSFSGELVTSSRSECGNSSVINIEDKNSYGYINMYAVIIKGYTANNVTFYPMLNFGEVAFDYEPYISEDYGLSEAVELGKWDNINPQSGKLKRATKTVTITSDRQALPYYNYGGWGVYVYGLVEDEIHGDPEYISSSNVVNDFLVSRKEIYILGALDKLGLTSDFPPYYDLNNRPSDFVTPTDEQWSTAINNFYEWLETNPITLEYEDKENATETYINLSDGYTAWSHGSETTNQGTIDNSQYGAMFKITQSYLEEIGK